VSDILGHNKVNLAMDVYDRTDVEDFVQPLAVVFNELLPSCYPEGPPRGEPTMKMQGW
jgi:hypothetical protein